MPSLTNGYASHRPRAAATPPPPFSLPHARAHVCVAQEVSELLGTALTQADEEAALRELEEIQAEEGVDVLAALPSAPVAAVTATAVAADAKEAGAAWQASHRWRVCAHNERGSLARSGGAGGGGQGGGQQRHTAARSGGHVNCCAGALVRARRCSHSNSLTYARAAGALWLTKTSHTPPERARRTLAHPPRDLPPSAARAAARASQARRSRPTTCALHSYRRAWGQQRGTSGPSRWWRRQVDTQCSRQREVSNTNKRRMMSSGSDSCVSTASYSPAVSPHAW